MVVVGVDLGSSKTMATLFDGEIVLESTGSQSRPSLVGFQASGERAIGELAAPQFMSASTIKLLPALAGRSFAEASSNELLEYLGMKTQIRPDGDLCGYEVDYNGATKLLNSTAVLGMFMGQLLSRINELYGKEQEQEVVLAYGLPPGEICQASIRAAYHQASAVAGLPLELEVASTPEKGMVSSRVHLVSSDLALCATYQRKILKLAPAVTPEIVLVLEMGLANTSGK